MAASCWPSSIMRWSFKMGASAPFSRLLFLGGRRLRPWLPTPQKVPTCILRDEVPSLYPTMSSAFPMDVRQSVAGCTVRVIRRPGRFFEELRRTPFWRSSRSGHSPKFALRSSHLAYDLACLGMEEMAMWPIEWMPLS